MELNDTASLRDELDQVGAEQREAFNSSGWWHSVDLGGGVITSGVHKLEELRDNYARFNLPDDLTGKRVLDVGCWDGFYSFESERRGAQVVAVDVWRPENFFKACRALGSRVEFHELSVYQINRDLLGSFDVVLFLGVLYHLRHPLLALERICEVTNDVAVIESHVIDNIMATPRPIMEFYEIDELAGQYDNWWGPNARCVSNLVRSAGFARSETLRSEPTRAVVKAYRQWDRPPLGTIPTMRIKDVINAVTLGRYFPRRGRQAYLIIRVEGLPGNAARETVQAQVGRLGITPYYVGPDANSENDPATAEVRIPIPPGLLAGPTSVKVFFEDQVSSEFEINVTDGAEEKAFVGL